MGAAWTWNPPRWRTHDGYVDYHSLVAMIPALRRHTARQRIETALAFRLGQGGAEVQTLAQTTEKEASE